MIKHDIENALVVITQLSKSIRPVLENMARYIRVEGAYHIASEKQLDILERSMGAMVQEAEKLKLLTDRLTSKYEGDSNDR